jgi:kinesin family protein C2/C3
MRVDGELKKFVAAFDLLEEAALAQQQMIRPALEEAINPLLTVIGSQDKIESALLGKYRREVAERKRLFNLVQELRGNIRVFVRCRPLLQDEVDAGRVPAFSFGEADDLDDETLSITDTRGTVKPFKFDRVYGHTATQERIFEDTKPLVTSVMDGYNVCIFAYGQTGSGKTYTMQGPDSDPGVNLRTLIELFTITEERSDDWRYTIKVAMVEIYNETIRDLLDAESLKKKYEIRQGPEGNYVPGLVEVTVTCIDDVTRLMQLGNENRSMASTAMNEYSSRSHSLLLITVEGANTVTKAKIKSKLTLVDLAGSERVSKSEVTGQRLVEAQNINRSLSALGDVMAGLHQNNSHIPYRNSKLTHLLADCLGGDSKTCVFVHCAPDRDNVNESICSLNFAVRVSKVELGQATRQVVGSKPRKK